ncbi:MAG TPA: biopolymer transporter ExbD [Tepidisphaeraceae bacterium]|nr:biopolymer transporter ExbD [Tepidisphaeraceae bacterium]
MINRRHIPESHSEHPNVVPLIDVMLCIIVFYMLAAKIGVTAGADDAINLPESLFGNKLELTNTLIINVTTINLSGQDVTRVTAAVDESGSGEPVAIEVDNPNTGPLAQALLRARYGQDRREGGTGINADNPKLSVVVRADAGRVKYRNLAPVLQAIAAAKIENINYNTRMKENQTVPTE